MAVPILLAAILLLMATREIVEDAFGSHEAAGALDYVIAALLLLAVILMLLRSGSRWRRTR